MEAQVFPKPVAAMLDAARSARVSTIAQVLIKDHTYDNVVALCGRNLAVIRCGERIGQDDQASLATMVAERTFVWAGLVYETLDHPGGVDGIESFHVSELDRLVARLVQLQEVYREAG